MFTGTRNLTLSWTVKSILHGQSYSSNVNDHYVVLQKVHSLFQSEVSIEWGLLLQYPASSRLLNIIQ
jgi:hypothetical protein